MFHNRNKIVGEVLIKYVEWQYVRHVGHLTAARCFMLLLLNKWNEMYVIMCVVRCKHNF